MKKILAFVLALVMVTFCFTACTTIEDDDPDGKGAVIDVYMGTKVCDLDPALAYTDENTSKILSLIFEGLMKLDADGNLEKALMDEYEIVENEKTGKTSMKITINETYWSDGSLVQTNDIIYAWKRILDPEFECEAAPLLYAIDGAYERKIGEIGEDDIGVYSNSKDGMVVEFAEGADIDEFLYNLASLALVPVRETKVKTYADSWSKKSSDLSTNGPFKVKRFSGEEGENIVLERSQYYYLSQIANNEALDKYVTPYQIVIHYDAPLDRSVVYDDKAKTDILSMIAERSIFYASNLMPKIVESFKASDVKYNDVASTYSYYINSNSAIGQNAAVRYALSIALDRAAIATAVGADAATGLIPEMVFNTKKGTSFRKKGGDILSASAGDAAGTLAAAGVDPSTFDEIYLYYLTDTENDSFQSASWGYMSKEKTIATMAKEAWEALGFKVVLKGVSYNDYIKAYEAGDYDVIGLDYQMMSAYPIYDLAGFSAEYSGRINVEETDSTIIYTHDTHKSGYSNADYDALIKAAFEADNQADRAAKLHEAEELLLKDGGVIPVVFNKDAYVTSGLSGVEANFWGANVFTKVYLNNYVEYLLKDTATTEATEEPAA